MEVTGPQRVVVTERSEVSAARLVARGAARAAGMSETDEHRVGTIATEFATNLIKHAGGGELLVGSSPGDSRAVDLVAVDRGGGIADVSRALADGYSSAGSAGTGLGAIRRLSAFFDLHTEPGRGTVMFARVQPGGPGDTGFDLGAVAVPKAGEDVCGDGYDVNVARGVLTLTVADGLGHGPGAREAAVAVTGSVQRRATDGLVSLLERAHAAARPTRGAAASIARVQRSGAVVQFAGVGNVAGAVCLGATRRLMVSTNGTLGHLARSFREYQYPWAHQGVLVLHTDGLASHWDVTGYPGLLVRHPAVVAAVLYRDFSRQRDDVTVVVAREAP